MFLVMFVLPQILVLGDRIVEKTSFQMKLPAAPAISQRMSGTTFVNGRVRGRISGFVDAEIHGVVHGDISAMMSRGSFDRPKDKVPSAPEHEPNGPDGSAAPPELTGPDAPDAVGTAAGSSTENQEGDAQWNRQEDGSPFS